MAKIDVKGIFDSIDQEIETKRKSPFSGYFDDVSTNAVGAGFNREVPETNFAKIRRTKSEVEESMAFSEKENSFGTIAKRTLNPVNLAKGAFNLAKQVVENPKESAYQAALGLSNGLSLGATDFLQRRAFVSEAEKYGMDEDTAKSMAEKLLKPDDNELSAIRGGVNFAGIVAPYAAVESLLIKGLQYSAPTFVTQYGRAAKLLADIGVFNAVGQVEESFKPENERNRKMRALIDTGAALTFFTGGEIFRRIRGTQFKSPFHVAPVQGAAPVTEKEIVVNTRQHLLDQVAYNDKKAGAFLSKIDTTNINTLDDLARAYKEALPKEMQTKTVLSSIDNWIQTGYQKVDFYSKLASGGDPSLVTGKEGAIRSIFQEGKVYTEAELKNLRGNAKVAVTIKTGAKDATEKGATKDLIVITNDLESLKNYIKGSSEIEYKKIATLGTDSTGNKILARHEFNPKTGAHIIYSTDEATASTLAHELGHYFDKQLTKTTSGLSRLLPVFEANRENVEDVLGSLAVRRLGGEATGKQISAEVGNISKTLVKEIESLSAVRREGVAATSPSEQFADAVSQVLTRSEAQKEAPVLTQLLKQMQETNSEQALGEAVAKKFTEGSAVEKAKTVEAKKTEPKIEVQATQKFDIGTDKDLGKVAIPRVGDKVIINGKEFAVKKVTTTKDGSIRLAVYDSITRKRSIVPLSKLDNVGTLQAAAKDLSPRVRVLTVKPTLEGRIKEVPKQLDRTPTGKKPDTVPIRAEKMTLDNETEVFLNTKVLPKITGKERIGKSNEDILERSLSSKMTEKDFDNILNERFGNLAEDVVKSKRIINDRIQSLRDKMIGKNVDQLSATELKDVTMEYEKLIETVEVFSGMRTELSNAFRSLGIDVAPGENDILRQVFTKMQEVLGKEGDNFGFLQKALKLRENNIVDKYFTIWYPAILSGPKTTIRNVVGTGTNVITEVLSQLFSKEGRKTFGDRILGMVGSSKQAWEDAAAILRGDQKILSKFHEGPPLRRPDFKGPFAFLNKVEYVGRFLDAQDAFFSTIAKEGEVAALRAGNYTYGLTDEVAIKTINEAVSKAFGQRSTYRNQFDRTVMGELGRQVTALKNSEIAGIKFASNFIIPFVRTIANVTDRKIDYIPFINMFRVYKGKATPFIKRRATRITTEAGLHRAEAERVADIVSERLWHQQMGKMYMGLSSIAAIVPLAMAGRITGAGPKDKNERDTLMLKGWRPQSIILPGGVVLPYQNLGPLSGVLSIAGNISDGIKYGNADESSIMGIMGIGILNFMRGEIDQSYLAGFSDVYDLISPYSYRPVEDIIGEFALNGIPVPAAWTQTKDIIFPERFEAHDFDEKILNKIGFTSNLEPKLDAFGRQMNADLIWGLTSRLLNSDDKVLNWMDENNVFIGKPNRKQTIKNRRTGEEREMTPKEYTGFLTATGQQIYDKLERNISSGTFNRYTQEQKDKLVDSIVTDIRQKEKSRIQY